ncbi:hypothetical protein M9458_044593, partial [Cirrhinus mrigala]
MEFDLIDFTKDIEMELPACPEQNACLDFPPTLPLLSPPIGPAASVSPLLSPDSPAAHPQSTTCVVGSTRVCQSPSASWLEDPSSLPPATQSWTPPRPFDPAAPPWLSASSSPPLPFSPQAPPGSIVPPALSWSIVILPSPHRSIPLALSPSVLCHTGSTADLRSSTSASVARALGSALTIRILSVALDHRLSVSTSGSTSTCSTSVALPPPWLLPPSAPPWATIMAAAWVSSGSSCSGSLLSPPWLHPPSDPPWTLLPTLDPSVSSLALPSVVTTLDFVCCPLM